MSARYRTWVDRAMLPYVRDEAYLPDGLRVARELGPDEHRGAFLVEFEDDNAPAELDGHEVTLLFSQDDKGNVLVHSRTAVPDA